MAPGPGPHCLSLGGEMTSYPAPSSTSCPPVQGLRQGHGEEATQAVSGRGLPIPVSLAMSALVLAPASPFCVLVALYPCVSTSVCLVAPCVPVYLHGPGRVTPRWPSTLPSCCPTPAPQCYLSPFATVATATPLTVSLDGAPRQGPLLSPTLPCKCPPATLTWFTRHCQDFCC